MEHRLPDWNFYENFHLSNQKRSIGPEKELVELLWRDGQVVLQSQTHRKPAFSNPIISQTSEAHNQDHQRTLRSQESSRDGTFLEDQETVSWIQYPPDDPFEKEFSSHFFSAIPPLSPVQPEKPGKQLEQEEMFKFGGSRKPETSREPSSMPPPKFKFSDSKAVSFGDFARESSVMTVGPSHCGSNQLQNDLDITTTTTTTTTTTNTVGLSTGSLRENGGKDVCMSDRSKNDDTIDPNATSSSGGSSGCSFGRTSKEAASGVISGRKRKGIMETEESVSQSGATGNKSIQRSGSTRRSRAAEVHNLSERRRRDRINEKMRALQELIPHCSKTDKASILDEAIDYLKSLQLQLQVMWMGSGMAPMMFNGVQPYIPRMGMQMPSSIQNPMHLSGFPVLDGSMAQNPGLVCQNPVLNPVQYQNQAQNPVFSEQFARYIGGFPQMQAASQMNMLRFGPPAAHQSQVATTPATAADGGGGGSVTGAGAVVDNLPFSK